MRRDARAQRQSFGEIDQQVEQLAQYVLRSSASSALFCCMRSLSVIVLSSRAIALVVKIAAGIERA